MGHNSRLEAQAWSSTFTRPCCVAESDVVTDGEIDEDFAHVLMLICAQFKLLLLCI